MKVLTGIVITGILLGFNFTNAQASGVKNSFLYACSGSPYISETSDCTCIYNDVDHSFGADDLPELIAVIEGSAAMDKEVEGAINFISGKCED